MRTDGEDGTTTSGIMGATITAAVCLVVRKATAVKGGLIVVYEYGPTVEATAASEVAVGEARRVCAQQDGGLALAVHRVCESTCKVYSRDRRRAASHR